MNKINWALDVSTLLLIVYGIASILTIVNGISQEIKKGNEIVAEGEILEFEIKHGEFTFYTGYFIRIEEKWYKVGYTTYIELKIGDYVKIQRDGDVICPN